MAGIVVAVTPKKYEDIFGKGTRCAAYHTTATACSFLLSGCSFGKEGETTTKKKMKVKLEWRESETENIKKEEGSSKEHKRIVYIMYIVLAGKRRRETSRENQISGGVSVCVLFGKSYRGIVIKKGHRRIRRRRKGRKKWYHTGIQKHVLREKGREGNGRERTEREDRIE